MQCVGINRETGERCKAHSLTGEQKCHFHSETQAEARKQAQRKGGKMLALKVRGIMPAYLQDEPALRLETPEDARVILQKTLNWALTGKISEKVTTSVTGTIGAFIRLLEVAIVEKRLAELERRLVVEDNDEQTVVEAN